MSELENNLGNTSHNSGGGKNKPVEVVYGGPGGPDSFCLADNLRVAKKTNPYILTSKTQLSVILLFGTGSMVAFAGWLYFMYAYFVEKSEVIPVAALIIPILISVLFIVLLYFITRSYYTVTIDERTRNIRVVETEKRKIISDQSFNFDQVENIRAYLRTEERTINDQEKTVYYSMCCVILKNGGQIQFAWISGKYELTNKQGRLMAKIFGKKYSDI